MAGMGIDYLFLAYAPTIFWLFVGRIFIGITGASMTAASAYIADISAPEKRAQNFGLLGMAVGIGFMLGPVIGGLVSQTWGSGRPSSSPRAFPPECAVRVFYPPRVAQTGKPPAVRLVARQPWGGLRQLKRYRYIYPLLGSVTLIYIAAHAIQSNWTYYTMFVFKWTETMVGYSLSFAGLMLMIVQEG